MHILIVNWHDRLHPQAGGAERHLHEVFGRAVDLGHRVTLLACGWPGAPSREVVDGIDVHRVGSRLGFALSAPRAFDALVARERPDVVVENVNKLPLLLHRRSRVPTVALVHHLFGRAAFAAAPLPVAALALAGEAALAAYRGVPVQAVSESTAIDLARRGVPRAHVRVIHNGTDLRRAAAAGGRRARDDEPMVLAVGRLQRYKRMDLVVRAVARLVARGDRVRLVIAGDGPERSRLERLARGLGVGHRVTLAGRVGDDALDALYARAWLHASASRKEGWGLTVFEAAACEVPTVAVDVAGLRDSVVHRRTGVLVREDDEAMADALAALLADHATRARMGREARAWAGRFTWSRTAAETLEDLALVAAGGGARRSGAGIRWERARTQPLVAPPRTGTACMPWNASRHVAPLPCAVDGRVTLTLGARAPEGDGLVARIAGAPPALARSIARAAHEPAVVDAEGTVEVDLPARPAPVEAWLAHLLHAACRAAAPA